MKHEIHKCRLMIVGIALCLATGSHGVAQTDSNPYDKIKTYDCGQDAAPLNAVEKQIRQAVPGDYSSIEEGLIAVIASPDSTFAGKQFACRMLRAIGTEKCVPVLKPLLLDKKLSHTAGYALEAMPGQEVEKAFVEAIAATTGETRIGNINSLGERRSSDALPVLADLLIENDATASLFAVSENGLSKEQPCVLFRVARVDSRKMCDRGLVQE